MNRALRSISISVFLLMCTACHKTTLDDCGLSNNKTCTDLAAANAKTRYDNAMRDAKKQADEYNARIDSEEANDTSPKTGYENMTKGLPGPK